MLLAETGLWMLLAETGLRLGEALGLQHRGTPAAATPANRLVGILHGCLKTGTKYNENTAWHHQNATAA
jgi:hypothetical protein